MLDGHHRGCVDAPAGAGATSSGPLTATDLPVARLIQQEAIERERRHPQSLTLGRLVPGKFRQGEQGEHRGRPGPRARCSPSPAIPPLGIVALFAYMRLNVGAYSALCSADGWRVAKRAALCAARPDERGVLSQPIRRPWRARARSSHRCGGRPAAGWPEGRRRPARPPDRGAAGGRDGRLRSNRRSPHQCRARRSTSGDALVRSSRPDISESPAPR